MIFTRVARDSHSGCASFAWGAPWYSYVFTKTPNPHGLKDAANKPSSGNQWLRVQATCSADHVPKAPLDIGAKASESGKLAK